jgi:hypothetical protein
MAAKHFIQGAIKHPGALHEDLGVPKGRKLTDAQLAEAEAAGGKEAQRARFARTLRGFHHDRGKAAKEVAKSVKRRRKARKKS